MAKVNLTFGLFQVFSAFSALLPSPVNVTFILHSSYKDTGILFLNRKAYRKISNFTSLETAPVQSYSILNDSLGWLGTGHQGIASQVTSVAKIFLGSDIVLLGGLKGGGWSHSC